MTLFIILHFLVAATSYRLVTRRLYYTEAAEFLVAWCLLCLAQIVAICLSLGSCRILNLHNVVSLTLALFLMALLFTRGRPVRYPVFIPEKWQYALRGNYAVLLLTGVILGFSLVKIAINLMNAPFGWDSLNYHFTFAVEWMKNGTLDNPIVIGDDFAPTYYPFNGSLVYFWMMLPVKSVFLADLGQVFFFALGFLSVFALARRMRLSSEYAFFAAGLFTLVPNYFKQLEIAYVDVMVSALFLSACVYLARLRDRFTLTDVLMCSLAAGLSIGTKTVGLAYSLLLVIALALLCFMSRRPLHLISAFAVIFLFGGYAYLRNFVETGNPLYPCEVSFLGKVLFPGVVDLATINAHMEEGKRAVMKLLFHEGMGTQSLLFIVPGIIACAAAVLQRRGKTALTAFSLLCIGPVALFLLYRFCIPLANSRYLYPALGLGMVSGLYAAKAWNVPRRLVQVLTVICAMVSAAETASHAELAACVILTALLCVALWYARAVSRRNARTVVACGSVFCVLLTGALYPLHAGYLRNEYATYESSREYSGFWPEAISAWQWVNDHTGGDAISYTGRPVPFPLYGTGFKNDVYYTSVNAVDPAKIHYYKGSRYRWGSSFGDMHANFEQKQNYRGEADYGTWLAHLRRRKTGLLFVYSLHQTDTFEFPVEDAWAREHPESFEQVFENRIVRVYRLNKVS